jgi:hemolysin III
MDSLELIEDICPLSGETVQEDYWNFWTHLLGLLLSFIGFGFLLHFSSHCTHLSLYPGLIIYGVSQLALFASSTIYHAQKTVQGKYQWRIIDHISILFIQAGTFSSFLLGPFRSHLGMEMFILQWCFVLIGSFFKLFYFEAFQRISLAYYFGMSGIFVIQFILLYHLIPLSSFILGMVGALIFCFGALFFLWDSLPYNHTIWHVLVMLGAGCHYFAILALLPG